MVNDQNAIANYRVAKLRIIFCLLNVVQREETLVMSRRGRRIFCSMRSV